jgi:hypothetical protein
VTPEQERRLLVAALGFANADQNRRAVRRAHLSGERPDADGALRAVASKEKRRWKLKLLRAAGLERRQALLPLAEAAPKFKAPPRRGRLRITALL